MEKNFLTVSTKINIIRFAEGIMGQLYLLTTAEINCALGVRITTSPVNFRSKVMIMLNNIYDFTETRESTLRSMTKLSGNRGITRQTRT